MGRVSDKHSYQIKNTFVELVADDADFTRNQRTLSDTCTPASNRPGDSTWIPQTPSPMLSAQPDPYALSQPYPLLDQSQLGLCNAMPMVSFGDFGAQDNMNCGGYGLGEANAFGPSMQYDPNTGTYIAYEYTFVPYDASCFGMVSDDQMQNEISCQDQTQVLLTALSEKLGEDQIQVSGDACLESTTAGSGSGDGTAVLGDMEGWENNECWEGASWGHTGMAMGGGNYGSAEDQQLSSMASQQPGSRRKAEKAERREAREAARRQERIAAAAAISAEGSMNFEDARNDRGVTQWSPQEASQSSNGNITTVMFRNIPNKYTREMLVNQLEEDMKGMFDFIYLPIDFKNKCNVGYAFINFRTVEACESFVNRFNGVEVRKCLPGLNSRKVTEVTPARVQGFEENVQRLRNSPVMRELMHKPEWLPLIFDYNGDQLSFPAPERPLDPIKPRRRARDEEARFC